MPSWNASIAKIRTPSSFGTGFLIAPDLLLTAGHVLMPQPGVVPAPGSVSVMINNTPHAVASYVVHDRWRQSRLDSGDMAVIRLAAPAAEPPLAFEEDYQCSALACQGFGHSDTAFVGPISVTLTRHTDAFGFDMFLGQGLVAPLGVSGGPLIVNNAGAPLAIGVIIGAATSAALTVYVGLPLLAITYGDLMNRI